MSKRLFFLVIFLLFASSIFAQTPYRIKMPRFNYSTQLRGVVATRTHGISVNGTYSETFKMHEFDVSVTGLYQLYADPAGGSSYVLVTDWGGAVGKVVPGNDFANFYENITAGNQVLSTGIGDTAIAAAKLKNLAVTEEKINTYAITESKIGDSAVSETKIGSGAVTNVKLGSNSITTDKILNETILQADVADSQVSLAKMTTAAVNYIGSGGNITNNPDDVTLENKTEITIGLHDSYIDTVRAGFKDGYRAVKLTDFGIVVDDSTVAAANRTALWNALAYADAHDYRDIEFPSGNIWMDSITVKYDSLNLIGTGNTNLIYKQVSAIEVVRFLQLSHRKQIKIKNINFNTRASKYSYNVYPIVIRQDTGDSESYSKDVSILYCNFFDCSAIISGYGTADTASVGFAIEHCTFRPNTELLTPFYNDRAAQGSANCFNGKFNHNYFYGGNSFLLDHSYLGYYESCEFIGNYIERMADTGLYIRGDFNTIAYNKLWYSGKDGIKVLVADKPTNTPSRGSLITQNFVWGAGATYGKDSATMIKAEGDHTICSLNFVFAIDTTDISPKYGILPQRGFQINGDSIIVSNNYVLGGYSRGYISYMGIRINDNSRDVVISDNYIYDWQYGIGGTYSDNIVIVGNTIKKSGARGISIDSANPALTVDRPVVVGNYFYDNANDDIFIKYADSLFISSNVTYGRKAGDFIDLTSDTYTRYGVNQDFTSEELPLNSGFAVVDSIAVGGADIKAEQDTAFYIGIGKNSLQSRALTLKYTNVVGYQSARYATGSVLNGLGYWVFQAATGSYLSGMGYRNAQYCSGSYGGAIGRYAAMYNGGSYFNLYGDAAGRWNQGDYVDLVGSYNIGVFNTGDEIAGMGRQTLSYNAGDQNSAFGAMAFNTFIENGAGAKTFDYTNIVVTGSDTIAITGHGFGSAGVQICLTYTQGTSAITGLTTGSIYAWKIIDANRLCGGFTQNITAAGTGTGHTFTPQTSLTNSTALGYNAEPDVSNQVKLGDANVTSVKSSGTVYVPGIVLTSSNASTTKIDTVKTAGGTVRWLKIITGGSSFWCPVDTSIVK